MFKSKHPSKKLIWSENSVRVSSEAFKETLNSENHKKNVEAVARLRELGVFDKK